jgi:hypothetical protein
MNYFEPHCDAPHIRDGSIRNSGSFAGEWRFLDTSNFGLRRCTKMDFKAGFAVV